MKGLYLSLIAVVFTLCFQNCGSMNANNSSNQQDDASPTKTLGSVHYFHGNWFGQAPNWRHDTTFDLNLKNIKIKYVRNSVVIKKDVALTEAEVKEVRDLLTEVNTRVTGRPMRVDGGTEFVELAYDDNSQVKAYIDAAEAPEGSLEIISNNKEIVEVLERIILSKIDTDGPVMCTMQYDPVCGVDGKTYGNSCTAGNVEIAYKGECKKKCDHDVAPKNCKNWYDGCNNCSRSVPGGPLLCTLRACFTQGRPVCNSYF